MRGNLTDLREFLTGGKAPRAQSENEKKNQTAILKRLHDKNPVQQQS